MKRKDLIIWLIARTLIIAVISFVTLAYYMVSGSALRALIVTGMVAAWLAYACIWYLVVFANSKQRAFVSRLKAARVRYSWFGPVINKKYMNTRNALPALMVNYFDALAFSVVMAWPLVGIVFGESKEDSSTLSFDQTSDTFFSLLGILFGLFFVFIGIYLTVLATQKILVVFAKKP